MIEKGWQNKKNDIHEQNIPTWVEAVGNALNVLEEGHELYHRTPEQFARGPFSTLNPDKLMSRRAAIPVCRMLLQRVEMAQTGFERWRESALWALSVSAPQDVITRDRLLWHALEAMAKNADRAARAEVSLKFAEKHYNISQEEYV